MKVVLLKDVPKVGRQYDIKEVSSGFAINLLIPKGQAVIATPEVLKKYQSQKAKVDGEKKIQNELKEKNLEGLNGLTLTMIEKANDKGHLFAGVHCPEIAHQLEKQFHIIIDPAWIKLQQPIKEIGQHDIDVVSEATQNGGKNIKVKFNLDIQALK